MIITWRDWQKGAGLAESGSSQSVGLARKKLEVKLCNTGLFDVDLSKEQTLTVLNSFYPFTPGLCTQPRNFKSTSLFWVILDKMFDDGQLLYTTLIWSAKISLNSPAGGYLCYFKLAHSSTHPKSYIYLMDVILALSWEARRLHACRNTRYTVQYIKQKH